jgi:hypothetical protein
MTNSTNINPPSGGTPPTTKTCKECGSIKPVEAFYARKEAKDGYTKLCKDCYYVKYRRPQYEREGYEAVLAVGEYDRTHMEETVERKKRWYAEHKEEAKEKQKDRAALRRYVKS